MIASYTREQLNNIARDNYRILREYCALLEKEGYWDGPRAVLRQSIYSILDMYLQTVLIQLALYCGKVVNEERRMIANLPEVNIYDVKEDEELDERILSESDRFFNSPPILLQLCGLRDKHHGSGIMGLFFDALLNIQLSLAFYSAAKTAGVAAFIRDYYGKVEAFISSESEYGNIIDEKYIFRKLCNGTLEKSAEALRESGEDFEHYKNKYLYLVDDNSTVSCAEKESAVGEASESAAKKEDSEKAEDTGKQEQDIEAPAAEAEIIQEDNDNTGDSKETELEKLLKELNGLVGLKQVKEEVNSLINLIKVRKLREQHGLPTLDMSYHMFFTGSPGTGKTTVARLIAGIYRELGIISKGNLVETDRSGLVAGYVGQTAIKVREVVDKAKGGVLFIDEAYSLSGQSANDFGDEAIETLVKLMEDNRDNLVVIAAGYTEEMKRFLKSNTGLASRFNRFIEFADYSDDELMEILDVMAEKAGYKISAEARRMVHEDISAMSKERKCEFGNARGMRNLFERMVVKQANRIMLIERPDIAQLTEITEDDVR